MAHTNNTAGRWHGNGVRFIFCVWSCMLHFVEDIVDQHVCLNILKGSCPFTFNKPITLFYNMRSWLLYNCSHAMHTPAQNPDISPIKSLWGYPRKKIRQYALSSKNDLKKLFRTNGKKLNQICLRRTRSKYTE